MLENLISLFFPQFCLACQQSLHQAEDMLCTSCRMHLPILDEASASSRLLENFGTRLPIAQAHAFLQYRKQGITQKILHNLKYNGKAELGRMLGRWYAKQLQETQPEIPFELILPVPLHAARKAHRGYNQSACIAEGMAEILAIEWSDDYLKRGKATKTQTRKSRDERWENVERIFEVIAPEKIANKHVLLVDDVVTTGATLENCALSLLDEGCSSLSIAALAVA